MWETLKRWWRNLFGRKDPPGELPDPVLVAPPATREPPPEGAAPEAEGQEAEEPAPAPLSALDILASMKREKEDNDEPDWDALRAKLKVKVFSDADRKRLWRRARRRLGGGEPRDLDEITEPTDEDLEALKALVADLARGR